MATFTILPTIMPTSRRRPRVLSTKFGDGYEQRGLDGINPDLQAWNVTFEARTTAEADTIESFFATHSGITPFTWTPPHASTPLQFICREWTRRIVGYDQSDIAATFEQVPEPA